MESRSWGKRIGAAARDQPSSQTQVRHILHVMDCTDACGENFSHEHSQTPTLTPTGRESPHAGGFVGHRQHGREDQYGQEHQFAFEAAHRFPLETANGIQSGCTENGEHLVGEATLGLQPGQELRWERLLMFLSQLLFRVTRRENEGWVKVRRLNTDERYNNM